MKTGSDIKTAFVNFIHGQKMIACSQEWEALSIIRNFQLRSSKSGAPAANPIENMMRLGEKKYRDLIISQQVRKARGFV